MNPFRWLKNVVSGRYRHWNEAQNRTFTGLWEAASALPPPASEMLQAFLVSSLSLCDRLLGPDSPDPLLRVDVRDLAATEFRRLHAAQTGAMAGTYAAINPHLRSTLRDGLSAVFPADPTAGRLFEAAAGETPPNLASLGPVVWAECLSITSASDRPLGGSYEYPMLFGTMAARSFAELSDGA